VSASLTLSQKQQLSLHVAQNTAGQREDAYRITDPRQQFRARHCRNQRPATMPGPVTPMSRARLAVRAIHRFKQAGQRQRNSQAAAEGEGLGPVEEEEAQPSATTPLLEVRLLRPRPAPAIWPARKGSHPANLSLSAP